MMPSSRRPPSSPFICEDFKYKTLDVALRQIRLIHLLPHAQDPKLCVSIRTVNDVADQLHPYNALSYVWGDESVREQVLVLQDGQIYQLQVTANCAEALRHLRDADNTKVLWVDAISINQADDVEKSSQVAMMADIYRNATNVIAWIGPATPETTLAMVWTRNAAQVLESRVSSSAQTSQTVAKDPEPYMDTATELAFSSLARRPWFERMWIAQEVSLGGEKSILRCGDQELLWVRFCKVVMHLMGKKINDIELLERLTLLSGLCSLRNTRPYDRVLTSLMYSRCTDPRDKIFAMKSLIQDVPQIMTAMVPNYRRSWRQVHSDFVTACIIGRGDLEILRYIESGRGQTGLPTWMPTLSEERRTISLPYGRANGMVFAQNLTISQDKLTVAGAVVDIVSHVIPVALNLKTGRRASHSQELTALIDLFVELRTLRPDLKDKLFTICEVLCLGFRNVMSTGAYLVSYQKRLLRLITRLFDADDDIHKSGDADQGATYVLTTNCYGRALFWSSDGKLGIAPAGLRTGDVIAVLTGADCPMILKPIGPDDFEIIGPAWIKGGMAGEALLGEVPPDFTMLVRPHGANWVWFYQHIASGNLQREDPRLPPIVHPWRVIPNQRERQFKNIITGEIRHWLRDPRNDLAELEKRGIKLRTFNIL